MISGTTNLYSGSISNAPTTFTTSRFSTGSGWTTRPRTLLSSSSVVGTSSLPESQLVLAQLLLPLLPELVGARPRVAVPIDDPLGQPAPALHRLILPGRDSRSC